MQQETDLTIADLTASIANQVSQIGQAVSIRVHVSVVDSHTEWDDVASIAHEIVASAFELDDFSWRIRSSSTERIQNRLGENSAGRTALVTLARGYDATVAATVFGNHGTLRFDEARFVVE
jgi:hypothetical protein